ncbi:hypothetical protein, partial [Dermabacter sp.]|uniref:hypothetical protein n=1 Tax=Dermabacter sp. TaxID=37640 RepID=UPI002905460F
MTCAERSSELPANIGSSLVPRKWGEWGVRVLFDISIVCLFIDANFFLAGTLNFLFNFWMVSVMLIVLFLLGLDFSVF